MAMPRYAAGLVALVLGIPITGCKQIRERLSPAASSSKTSPAALGRAATDAEAAAFAEQLRLAIESGKDLATLIDAEAMIARGSADLDLPAAMAKGAGTATAKRFEDALRTSMHGGGSYKLLANREIHGERRVKFRLLGGDGSFNYHDYVVVVRSGTPKAVDIHIITTSEPMSATLRRSLLPLAAEAKKNIVERLTTKESTYVKHLPTIAKMGDFQTNPRGALAAYATLPNVLKTDKNLLMLQVQAASQVDDAAYLAAMDDYRRAFPNDASMRVMSIDYFYMKKMLKEALEQVSALEKAEGPDAHLNTLRAGIHSELGNVAAARAEIARALELEPDLAAAVNVGIALDLAASDDVAALEKIKNARKRNVDLGTVSKNPDYVAFLALPSTKKALETEPEPTASAP